MACPGEGILTDLARRLVDKAIKEVNYIRHFETHVHQFEQDNQQLQRKLEKVNNDIENAKRSNQYEIEGEVQDWIKQSEDLIQRNSEIWQTRSDGRCPFIKQYRQGKILAKRTPGIRDLIQKCDFQRVAPPTELPGIKYHASRDFIDFESRKTKFMQLVETLKDGKHSLIGLQGMGGTGKTTLATQVGKQLEESKAFEKVIFVVVSNPPDINKIRADIARPLGLDLEKNVEAEQSQHLWSKISNNENKLLIILDDVWEELNLTGIGIPSGLDHKKCYVLVTTRHSRVCRAMGCTQIVQLETLSNKDALTLFLHHAKSGDNTSSNDLEGLAQDFLKECGGLPVAIVALASTLRNWHVGELNAALIALQKSKLFVDVDEDLVNVYSCLRLSYDYLHNKKAQQIFLLCSIFPEDYEFSTDLILRLGIGSGIFEEADDYCTTRSQVLTVKNKLIDSSLLQKVGKKEYVKMHDLVREAALWIAKEDVQVIKGLGRTLKPNTRFVFWSTDDFPKQFDETNLEILLLWISGNVLVKDPNQFARMLRLKILFLLGEYNRKVPCPSMLESLLSLQYIHTLILDSWELGDISILKNIQSLVTIELKNCQIIELPRNIMELMKLRWLGLRKCEIQRNNPFEVISICSQLKELYFVGNYDVKDRLPKNNKVSDDEISHDASSLELQVFSIAKDGFERFPNDDNGLLRCFNSKDMEHLIPDVMFRYLVRSAEVLELRKKKHVRWKNLSPDVIPLGNGSMDNLIKLYLYEWDDIECLIDCSNKDHYSNITSFSKLVELHLRGVDLKKLYVGIVHSSFLRKLQVLKLEKCMQLQNIFSDENIKLPHLKVLILIDCPMFQPFIFQLSVAQSLKQLEELEVKGCEELKGLIAYEGSEMTDALFPELKSLRIRRCGKLEMVLPVLLSGDLPKLKDLLIEYCVELKCIFGEYRDACQVLQQEIILPSLTEVDLRDVPSFISVFQNCKKCELMPSTQAFKEDSREKDENSKSGAFSWAYGCCFLAQTKDTIISQVSSKRMETLHAPVCLLRQPFSLQNIKELRLDQCSKLKSLFNVSIATTIMLEKLEIRYCEELKHLITHEAEDDDHLKCTSIFPKLQSLVICNCYKLEFIFPSTLFGGLQNLKSIHINSAKELKYVFGRYDNEECASHEIENNESHIHLPTLESLYLWEVPNMISIGINKYQQNYPSLPIVEEPQMQDVISERVKESKVQEIVDVDIPSTPTVSVVFQYFLNFHNLKTISIIPNQKLKTLFTISVCKNLPQLSKLNIFKCSELVCVVEDCSNNNHHLSYSSTFPKLEELHIRNCNKLEYIFPLSFFGSLQKLKSLIIREATELKGIFKNENDELHIELSTTLERLWFVGVPELMNKILAKKCHLMSFLSLRSIGLGNLQEFNGRSFLDLMAFLQGMQLTLKVPKDLMKIMKDVQKLTNLYIGDSKIEEVVNLEGVEIEGGVLTLSVENMRLKDHCELRHIWKGPKDIIRLPNLGWLEIKACKKIRVIFSTSVVKSLPQLGRLNIEDCDELVDIIEESDEDPLQHQICFPKLHEIYIKRCNSLKCLFSISTCDMFPNLYQLRIEEASEMEQVFIHKQDDVQNMKIMEQVFATLSRVTLKNLSRLVTICEGIDFQTLKKCEVDGCPKYIETYHIQEGPEDGGLGNQAATNALPDLAEISETSKEVAAGTTSGSSVATTASCSNSKILEIRKEVVGTISELSMTTTASCSNSKLDNEDETSESLMQFQQETKTTKASYVTNEPFHDSSVDAILKERATEEGSTSEDVVVATMVADLKPMSSRIIGSIEEDITTKKAKSDTLFIHSQAEGSQSGPSIMTVDKIQEDNTTMATKIDASSSYTQPSPSMMISKDTKDETLKDGPKPEKVDKPTVDNTSLLPNVIPSSHHQSQTEAETSSSPILEIGEIFQLVELKDGEAALLVKALELYPQLKLSRGQRTHPIIAFSYRVLVDILVMLATKTPSTMTETDRTTLEANLGAVTFLGFDKDWVEMVRHKVFGIDNSDVLAAEEKISVMEEELEKCDSQLFDLLENRKNLVMKIAEFRKITRSKDKPFGI